MIKWRQVIFAVLAAGLAACQSQERANVIRPVVTPEVEEAAVVAEPEEKSKQVVPETEEKAVEPTAKKLPPPVEPKTEETRPVAKSEPAKPVAVTVSKPRPFEPKAPGHRVSHVNVPGMYVALTFDDGPSAVYTPQVLDILKKHGARATFFVLGQNAARNKGILARAVAEGHEIANHTYSHIKMTASGRQTITGELERTSAIIKEATGYYPTTMRPPYGAINSGLVDMVYNTYGMHAVLWDVDTRDWQHPGVAKVVERAVGKAQSGSIILLHDIHASTLEAVEQVVTGLQNRGFKLVTVSQLIEMGRRAAAQPSPATPASEPTPDSLLGGENTPSYGESPAEGAAEISANADE